MDLPVPDGFIRLKLDTNPFLGVNGPLYGRLEGERFTLGMRVETRHCNPGRTCHGGMVMTFADMALLLGSNAQAGIGRYMLTVSLAADFIAAVPVGAWLEGRTEVLRVTRSLVFTQGILSADGTPAVRVNATLKPTGEYQEQLLVKRYFA